MGSIDINYKRDARVGKALYEARRDVRGVLADESSPNSFWRIVERQEIQSHHPIVHAVITRYVDILSNMINNIYIDDNDIVAKYIDYALRGEQSIDNLVRDIATGMLSQGDVCVKIEYDPEISRDPLVIVVDGYNVDYKTKKGRIIEATFNTVVKDELGNKYVLKEIRGNGFIKFRLEDINGEEVPLSMTDSTKDLVDLKHDRGLLFVPIRYNRHPIDKHRGRPLFYDKIDSINTHDEAGNKTNAALRASEPYVLFNEKVVTTVVDEPTRTPAGFMGRTQRKKAKPYKGQSIIIFNDEMDKDGDFPKLIDYVNIDPKAGEYEKFQKMALDNVLLGIMSPETLGIESRTLDANATAQRDREQITSDKADDMASIIVEGLKGIVDELVNMKELLRKRSLGRYTTTIFYRKYRTLFVDNNIELIRRLRHDGDHIISKRSALRFLKPDITDEEIEEELMEIMTENNIMMEDDYLSPEYIDKILGVGEDDKDDQ